LARKRQGLLYWASGALFAFSPGAGPTLILLVIALPLLIFCLKWVADVPMPANISATRVWFAFAGFVILCVAWTFVRKANLRAAEAIRRELEAMDSSNQEK
jgi:hypothetical protein